MVMDPAGPGTKNNCAGECQQKFTSNPKPKVVLGFAGPEIKNDWAGEGP
jgi:hypothetical protein